MMDGKDILRLLAPRGKSFHLAESSDISRASICGFKFKLPRIMGAVPEGDELYIPGTIAHRVLERAVPETLVHLWQNHASCDEVMSAWRPHMNCVFEQQRLEQDIGSDIEEYLSQAENRVHGIANALQRRITNEPVPIRILTEVTITNTFTRHEGRIDAIFEHETANGIRQETVEWKTYADKKMSEGDKLQTISNGMLVNHRYGRSEDDFAGNSLTVIMPNGIQHPEPTALIIDKVRNAREYVLNVLDGERVRAKLPYHIVCGSCSYRNACSFYMNDMTDPARRKIFWSTRFRVLKERERAHMTKFLVDFLPPNVLAQLGIAEYGYGLYNTGQSDIVGKYIITLRKQDIGSSRFDNGESIRVIALEPNTPILACISCTGHIREINEYGRSLVIEINGGQPSQLRHFPIMLLKTDVDLTKRELGSIDFIHRIGGRRQEIALAILGEQ
jgi:PD-(D/E)XK nuclease superfamily